ncbi:inositol-pentakisphosphate 2-kinase [Chytriomyces sp. MP71]|nr:inositol-pentakisphosphate 2-kinase [Chytriomyces sp. MP71]
MVVSKLLGSQYAPRMTIVSTPRCLYSPQCQLEIESQRTHANRIVVDYSQPWAVLMEDQTHFPSIVTDADDAAVFAIEIKPKWGFLPPPHHMMHHPIKGRHCRFCMHSLLKTRSKPGFARSTFCPLDLFSCTHERVLKALRCLELEPGNNLRAFVNGNGVLAGSANDAFQKTFRGGRALPSSIWDLVANILCYEPLLRRLSKHQRCLDRVGIEKLWEYQQRHGALQPESVDEWKIVLLKYLETGFGNEANSVDPPHLKSIEPTQQSIFEFLMSASLKDCSIMISLRRKTTSFDTISQDATGIATLNDHSFEYKIRVIDVDIKSVSKLAYYCYQDNDICNIANEEKHLLNECFE